MTDRNEHQKNDVPSSNSVTPTWFTRRAMAAKINGRRGKRSHLEAKHGQVWSTKELAHDFDVLGFAAPFIVVRRKSDRATGSLMFQHTPRFYFSFDLH